MECNEYTSDDSEYSEEDLGLLKRALQVDLPQNFDPNKIPANGEEYLQHVMYEASKCPDFVVAPINIKRIKPQTVHVEIPDERHKTPSNVLPDQIWQEQTISNFVQLRNFIFKHSPANSSENANIKQLIVDELPKLSTLLSLSQENKIKALAGLLDYLKALKSGESLSRQKGMWIYSLLATLDIPLHPDTCHFLRELARQCSMIRLQLHRNSAKELFTPLNLCICIISRYFRQLDLADE